MGLSQAAQMRENLVNDLIECIDKHRVEVGMGLSASDVVGAIEWVKMEVFMEANADSLLRHTSYSLD